MQAIQTIYEIDENTKKDELLSIVSDKYCRAILHAIVSKPKSALEISAETEIPISTVYRRVQTLYDNKLVQSSGMITEDGKKLFLYKSKIKGINSKYLDGQIEVELISN